MKKTLILAAVFTMLFTACNNSPKKAEQSANETQKFDLDTMKLSSGQTFYQCEMHHAINSDKPGICPKCKMDLTEIKKH